MLGPPTEEEQAHDDLRAVEREAWHEEVEDESGEIECDLQDEEACKPARSSTNTELRS